MCLEEKKKKKRNCPGRYRTLTLLVLSTLHIQVHKILKLTLDLELVEKEVETSKILMLGRWDFEEDQIPSPPSPSPFADLPPSPLPFVDLPPNCTFEAGNPTVDTTHISDPSVSPCTAVVDSMPPGLNLTQPSPSLLVTRRPSLVETSSSVPPVVDPSTDNVEFHQQPISARCKASHIPINKICIGSWKKVRSVGVDLMAKFYFAKKRLIWEILEGDHPKLEILEGTKLKKKMEIRWSDITALKAKLDPDEPGLVLQIELGSPPSFNEEIPPLPLKHTNWKLADDFTQGEAKLHRRHYVSFPPGALDDQLKKLLQLDPNLANLSKKPFPTEGSSPYFNIQQPQPPPIPAVNYPHMGYGRGQHTARANQLNHYHLGAVQEQNNQMIHQNPNFPVDQMIPNNANFNPPIIPNLLANQEMIQNNGNFNPPIIPNRLADHQMIQYNGNSNHPIIPNLHNLQSEASVLEQNQIIHQNANFLVGQGHNVQMLWNNGYIDHPIIHTVPIVDDRVRMMQQQQTITHTAPIVDDRVMMMQQQQQQNASVNDDDDWLLPHTVRPNCGGVRMEPALPYPNPNPNPNSNPNH